MGKLVGQKPPFKVKEIWAMRLPASVFEPGARPCVVQLSTACDLAKLRVRDVSHGDRVAARAIVPQQKTQRPVPFEITEQTRETVVEWIKRAGLRADDCLFPSRVRQSPHLSTRQYARIVEAWVSKIGLDPEAHGTHSLRRTEVS